jgi:hypothetical protein
VEFFWTLGVLVVRVFAATVLVSAVAAKVFVAVALARQRLETSQTSLKSLVALQILCGKLWSIIKSNAFLILRACTL